MINESVLATVVQSGWGACINLDTIAEAVNDRVQRLVTIFKSGNFGIVSPARSFPYHADLLHKGMRPLNQEDPADEPGRAGQIFKGDQTVAKFVGGATGMGAKPAYAANHNAKAWKDIRTQVGGMGFKPLMVTGSFKEKGGKVATEAGLVIPGISLEALKKLAGQYNQDSFIYAGPDTKGEVHLYEVSSRGKSGLPTAYDSHFSIGKAETPAAMKTMLARLHAKDGDPEKIMGATQPRAHGEPANSPRFGTKLGAGKATSITDPMSTQGKTYIP